MYTKALLVSSLAALGAAEVFTVDVGEKGLVFDPKTIKPKKGDTVIFHLYASHDVVSGSFDKPCEPADNAFFSGPYSGTDGGKKKFVVNVTSSDPTYYYCSVEKHCQSGMVGGWNIPGSGNTIDKYADAAKDVSSASAPSSIAGGQLLEDEQIASLTQGASGSASATPSGSSSASGSGSAPASTTASGSASQSSPAAASSSSAAADTVSFAGQNGFLAAALGFAAWFL